MYYNDTRSCPLLMFAKLLILICQMLVHSSAQSLHSLQHSALKFHVKAGKNLTGTSDTSKYWIS